MLFIRGDIRQFLFRHIFALPDQLTDALFHLRPFKKDGIVGNELSVFPLVGDALGIVPFVKAQPPAAARSVLMLEKVGPFLGGVTF